MSSDTNTGIIELELRAGLFLKNNLVIDELGIEFNKEYVLFGQVESLRYGIVTSNNEYGAPSINYTFNFLKSDQNKFTVYFSVEGGSNTKSQQQEAAANNLLIINALWKHLTSKIVNEMIQALNLKETVKVGNFEAERNGIRISYKRFIFFKHEVLLPWNDCLKGAEFGHFYIQSASNKKIKAKSSFLYTWNLNAFQSLLDYLWENDNRYKLQRGEKLEKLPAQK